jgi:hypothetical protein
MSLRAMRSNLCFLFNIEEVNKKVNFLSGTGGLLLPQGYYPIRRLADGGAGASPYYPESVEGLSPTPQPLVPDKELLFICSQSDNVSKVGPL